MRSVYSCRTLGVCLLVSSMSAALPSPAMAEPPAPAPAAARAVAPPTNDALGCPDALKCYQDGIAARQLGDWEKARALLLRSWGFHRDYLTAANLGEMELKLGRHREAAEHLAYFLKEAPASVPDADRARGQTMLDQARARLGTIRVMAPRDAEIYVDGQKMENVPLNGLILVEPGRRRVEARLRESPSIAETREVAAGSLVEVNVTVPVVPPIVHPPDDEEHGPKRWVVVAGTAVTAVGVAMGGGFAIASEVNRHERDGAGKAGSTTPCYHPADCEAYNAPERARGHFLTASLVSFLAAGAIGAGTLTYALVAREKTSKSEVRATVSAGLGGVSGGVGITW